MAKAKTRVVRATGVAAGTIDPSRRDFAARIQAAMIKAVEDANAEGISDPDRIRARMLKAREAVKAG